MTEAAAARMSHKGQVLWWQVPDDEPGTCAYEARPTRACLTCGLAFSDAVAALHAVRTGHALLAARSEAA